MPSPLVVHDANGNTLSDPSGKSYSDSGVSGFVTNALGGNAFSGATDLIQSFGSGEAGGHSVFYHMGQGVAAGPTLGFGAAFGQRLEGTPFQPGEYRVCIHCCRIFDESLQRLFVELKARSSETDWQALGNELQRREFFLAGPPLRALEQEKAVVRGRKWYGYFRRKTSDPVTEKVSFEIVPVVLGPKSEMSKFDAREALEREIARMIGQLPSDKAVTSRSVTFGWFVRKRYFLLKEADWSEETAKVKKYLIERDLLDDFEEVPLENFDKFSLQVHLNQLALTRSRDRVLQVRAYLRDIFFEAVDQDYLRKDPARKVKVPKQLRETDKTTPLGTSCAKC